MSRFRISVSLAAALFLSAICPRIVASARAQETARETQAPRKDAPDYSQEPLIYETVRGSMRFENDGTGTREVRVRLRVQTAVGLQKAGQLIFDYNAANEKVEIRSVRVIRNDGSTVSAGPDAVQDLSAPVAREAPMYTDARQKHVTVPGLSIGDTIEYNVVTTTFNPLTANQFWQTWGFIGDAISLDEQLELNVPRNRSIKLKSPPDVAPTVRDDGQRRIYHWTTSTPHYATAADLLGNASFSITKILKGPQVSPPRQVLFSTFSSWDDVGRWYESLEQDRRVVTPEVRAKADELIKGVSSDSAKAQALYQWVSKNIRYVSLSFGVGRYQPHAAAEILTNRYGDCKDKATLLETMMEAEGLHANTVLINSKLEVDPEVPSPLQFDHAITSLSLEGQTTWVDSTMGIGPFAYLLPQLRGKNALVVFPHGESKLVKTPDNLTIPTIYKLDVQKVADTSDKSTVKVSFDTRGDLEVLLRLGFMQLPPNQMLALINQAAKSQSGGKVPDVSFDSLKAGDPTDTQSPLHIEAQISKSKRNGGDEQGNSQKSVSSLEDSLELNRLVELALPEATQTPGQSGTQAFQPVEVNGPTEYSLNIVEGQDAAPDKKSSNPVHSHFVKDFATFDHDMEWTDAGFHDTWHLSIRSSKIPETKIAEYIDFRRQVLTSLKSADKQGETDNLEQSVAGDPQDGESFLRLGNNYLASQDYEKAVSKLENATRLLPNNWSAQISLGRAYLGMHQEEKAIASFTKAISLDNGWSALNDAAYYLGEEKGHLELAEQWSKRSIALIAERLNRSTIQNVRKQSARLTGFLAANWDTLGWIKFHEGDTAGAEKYVRAAWEIANFTDVGGHLAHIYQSQGRKADAIETYAQTLALVPSSRALIGAEKEDRNQLGILLGGDSLVDEEIQKALLRQGLWRSIQLENSSRVEGIGQFLLVIDAQSKVSGIRAVNNQSPVANLAAKVEASKLPQSFPDDVVTRIPRAGTLNCTSADQPCTFMLLPPAPALQFFPDASSKPAE